MKWLLVVLILLIGASCAQAQVTGGQLVTPPVTGFSDLTGMFSFGAPTATNGVVPFSLAPSGHLSRTLFTLTTPQTINANSTLPQSFAFSPANGNVTAAGSLNAGDALSFEIVGSYTTPNVTLSLVGNLTPTFVVNGNAVLQGAVPAQLPVNTNGTCSFDEHVIITVVSTGTSGSIRLDGWMDIQLTAGAAPIRVPFTTTLLTMDTTKAISYIPGGIFSAVQSGETVTINQMVGRQN